MSKEAKIAAYCYWDLPHTRIHHWQPKGGWAIGNGPIKDISEEEAHRLLKAHNKKGWR